MMLGMLKPQDEIFSKDYVPPPVRVKKDEPKVISIMQGFFKGLPQKQISKSNSRVRLKVTQNARKKVKELRLKEKKDALRLEIEMEKKNRVQQSPSRSNIMQGISFDSTKSSLHQ